MLSRDELIDELSELLTDLAFAINAECLVVVGEKLVKVYADDEAATAAYFDTDVLIQLMDLDERYGSEAVLGVLEALIMHARA